MEKETGSSRVNGVLVPVSESSDIFDSQILVSLQNSYLYEESKQSFRYKSAFLIENKILHEKYETFRTKKREAGYSEADLEESYGFLLFEDKIKANKLSETGVVTGHSTCTTLGDPSKGVYISKYSDCLDLNRWYHGKSGYIAIIRLTKGKVKNVAENYTKNYTSPSKGCDCHMSEQIFAVSANTSSFLAFERTQYYMYEFLDDGNVTTAQSPSHACPFAIVSFSYGDTNATHSERQEKRGHIQIFSQRYHVGLKSRTGPLIPAKLPTVIQIDRAIDMLELRQLLPQSVFETCFSGEVSLGGVCCSLYELVPSKAWDSSLSLLTRELKKKDLALIIELNDNGFLILLHSSNFLTYEDSVSNATEVLQAMFVFPTSREIHRDTKVCRRKPIIDSEVMQVLPALSYAETEIEKQSTDQSDDLCTLMEKHIQSYAALIHPGLATSPSREVSIFPDHYEVPDALKYFYATPKWTDRACQCLKSYLGQPISFQLSVSRAAELLAASREERGEEPEDEVYFCLSSPEGGPQESQDHDDISFDGPETVIVEQEEINTPSDKVVSDVPQPNGSTVKMLEDLSSYVPQPTESTVEMPEDLSSYVPPPTESTVEMPEDLSSDVPPPTESTVKMLGDLSSDVPPPTESTVKMLEDLSSDVPQPTEPTVKMPEDLSSDVPPPTEPTVKMLEDLSSYVPPPTEPTVKMLEDLSSNVPKPTESTVKMPEDLSSDVPPPTEPTVKMPEDLSSDVPPPTGSAVKMLEDLPCKFSHPIVSSKDIPRFSLPTESTRGVGNPDTGVLISTDCLVTEAHISPTAVDLHKELVVSITSAAKTVINMSLITDCAVPSKKQCVGQTLPTDRLGLEGKDSLIEKNERSIPSPHCPDVSNPPKVDWRKLPRRRRRGGKVSSKNKRILRSSVVKDREPVKEKEPVKRRKTVKERDEVKEHEPVEKKDPGKEKEIVKEKELDVTESLFLTESHPLKRKTERWELKAITTKCGRIFVPHGSLKQLRNQPKVADEEHCTEKTFEVSAQKPLQVELSKEPSLSVNMSVGDNGAIVDGNSVLNAHVSEMNSEQAESKTVDGVKHSPTRKRDLKEVDISKVDRADISPSDLFHGKHSSTHSPVQAIRKREFSLSKLKTVLLMGKRKMPHPVLKNTQLQVDAVEPLMKKNKLQNDTDKHQYADSNTADEASMEKAVHRKAITKTLPLDPALAQALGLTPKDLLVKTQKKKKRDTLVNRNSTNIEDRVTRLSTRRFKSRMKMLRKQQHISAESIQRKWWLHFNTPASYAGEKLSKQLQIFRSKRVSKSQKEISSGASRPTDALNLLADLALCSSNDQDAEQPEPALKSTLDQVLEMCDLTKESDNPDTQSVLHALLRQPTAKSRLQTKSPSPTGLVGSKEVVVLISKEHAYSLLSSSSLLMGLSGALLQVPPLTGSAGLQQHCVNIYGDEVASPENPDKDKPRRKKFRHLRSFAENEDGSVLVTRLWKDKYDFQLDSKFTNNSKDKAIIRALHGPWDFNVTDSPANVQLIVHMWIGLFYSRSTSRFFHFDSALASFEENDCAKVPCGILPAKHDSELRASLHAPVLPSTLKESDLLDLTKTESPVLNQGPELLDLSIKKSNDLNCTAVAITESSVLDVERGLLKGCTLSKQTYAQQDGITSFLQYRKPTCQAYTERENSTGKSELDEDSGLSPKKENHPSQICGEPRQYVPMPSESCDLLCEKIAHVCIQEDNAERDVNEKESTPGDKVLQNAEMDELINVINNKVDSSCDISNSQNAVEHDPTKFCYEDPDVMTNKPAQIDQAVHAGVKLVQPVCSRDNHHEGVHHPDQCLRVETGIKDGVYRKGKDPAIMCNGTNWDDGAYSSHNLDTDSTEQKTIPEGNESLSLAEKPQQVDNEDSPNKSVVKKQCGDDSIQNKACLPDDANSNDEHIMALQDQGSVKCQPQPLEHGDVEPVCGLSSERFESEMQDELAPQNEANALWGKNNLSTELNTNIPISMEGFGQTFSEAKKSNHSVVSGFNSEESHLTEGEGSHHATANLGLIPHTQHSLKDTEQVITGSGSDEAIFCTHRVHSKDKTSELMPDQMAIPLIGESKSRQNPTDTQVLHLKEKVKCLTQSPKNILINGEGCFIQDLKQPEVYDPHLSQEKCDSVPVLAGRMLTVFETRGLNQQMPSIKSDNRCPTPTVHEKPYNDIISPDPSSSSAVFDRDETRKVFKDLSRSSTPTQDELPLDQALSHEQYVTSQLGGEAKSEPIQSELTYVESTEYHLSEEQFSNSSCRSVSTESNQSICNNREMVDTFAGQELERELCHPHTPSFKTKCASKGELSVKLIHLGPNSMDKKCTNHPSIATDGLSKMTLGHTSNVNSGRVVNQNTSLNSGTSQDPCPISQRPIMAVRPSKSEDSQESTMYKEGEFEFDRSMTPYISENKQHRSSSGHTHNTLLATNIRRQANCSTGISRDLNREDTSAEEEDDTETYSQANWLSDDRDTVRKFNLDKTKLNLFDSLYQYQQWDRLEFEQALDFSKLTGNKASDWVQFCQDENIEGSPDDATISVSSVNQEENRFDKSTTLTPSPSPFTRTICNINREGSISVDQLSERCTPSDLTQSSMDQECLIFSENMKLLLKDGKKGTNLNKTIKPTSSYKGSKESRSNVETSSSCSPATVHFSSLEEQINTQQLWEALPSVVDQKIKVEWPERCGKVTDREAASHLKQLSYGKGIAIAHTMVSEVTAECSRTYHAMMKDVCAGKKLLRTTEGIKKDNNVSGPSTQAEFCNQMKIDMYESLQNNLNTVVRQSCKIKFRFYMLVTMPDPFFEETKAQLEAEGHNEVQPSQFFLQDISSSSPLLIVLRNEDIADHICEVPHLLELKKSPSVLFAGIDRPDDIVNLTHQELFSRGGFVVFEGSALDAINLGNMKKMSKFLEDLSKKGKWKLMLHYRDSRQLKDNARLSPEGKEKKQFMGCCQEAGLVEVLPYHECDVISRERPNYLNCLVRLQVQNVSARFPVFITNTTADSAFGKNGILTMNINSFLLISQSETCTVS